MFSLKWKCRECGAGFLTSDLLSMHSSVFHNNQENNDITYVNNKSSQQSIDNSTITNKDIKFDERLSGLKVVKKFHKLTPETLRHLNVEQSDGCVTEEEYLEEFSADDSHASDNEERDVGLGENGTVKTKEIMKSIFSPRMRYEDEYDTEESDPLQTDSPKKATGGLKNSERLKSVINMNTVLEFKCKRCDEIFSTKHERRLHMETHAKDLRFFCKICGRGFRKNQGLLLHLNVHTKGSKHQCSYCHNFYRTDRYLKEHVKLHMPEEYKFQCEICPKSFAHKTAFKYHMRAHYNIIPHVCNLCGKGYRQKPSLDSHMHMHRGTRPFSCALCGASFRMKQALRDHERLHTNERPFLCKYPGCHKSFILKNQLKMHAIKHDGVKRYHCGQEGCDKTFHFNSHRQRHEHTRHRSEEQAGADDDCIEEGQAMETGISC